MASLPDRPAALTKEVQLLIVQYIQEGNYLDPSCIAAGTTRETVGYWKKLYEAGAEHAQVYADFFTSLARAQSIAEVESVADVRTGRAGWQGQAWFLERRYAKRWLAKERTRKLDVKQSAEPTVIELPKKTLHADDQAPEGAAD